MNSERLQTVLDALQDAQTYMGDVAYSVSDHQHDALKHADRWANRERSRECYDLARRARERIATARRCLGDCITLCEQLDGMITKGDET